MGVGGAPATKQTFQSWGAGGCIVTVGDPVRMAKTGAFPPQYNLIFHSRRKRVNLEEGMICRRGGGYLEALWDWGGTCSSGERVCLAD